MDDTGQLKGAVNMLTDITARRQAEERMEYLVQLNADLERSNHELEQYAYIVSHDLQEPLRKIQTFAELLKTNIDDPEAVETYYNKVDASAKQMTGLINDVLNYSRLSRSEQAFTAVNLNQVLEDVRNDFDLLIEQKNAILTVGLLPLVMGDYQQLRQLFGNLVSNSLKFNEQQPRIQISHTLVDSPSGLPATGQPAGRYVKIIFNDNGIGFDQQYADQVFVVFKRLNNRQFYSGTGIGLALCKKIVEKHGGIISARSKLGAGATFTIFLPPGN